MTIISENFESMVDIDPIMEIIFFDNYNKLMPMRQAIFGQKSMSRSKVTHQRIGTIGDPPEFDGTLHTSTPMPDYQVVYEPKEYADSVQLTQSAFEDQQYDSIFTRMARMGTSFARRAEKDAALVLNGAFTGRTGYDGKTLCATDHPRSMSEPSITVSNKLTDALSSDSLEAAMVLMGEVGDDRGEPISMYGNLLVVPWALRKTAHELVESQLTPQNANNAENIHSELQYMVWPYLTSQKAWFLVDSVMSQEMMLWYDRIPVQVFAEFKATTLSRLFGARMRNVVGWSDWRAIVGSDGTT